MQPCPHAQAALLVTGAAARAHPGACHAHVGCRAAVCLLLKALGLGSHQEGNAVALHLQDRGFQAAAAGTQQEPHASSACRAGRWMQRVLSDWSRAARAIRRSTWQAWAALLGCGRCWHITGVCAGCTPVRPCLLLDNGGSFPVLLALRQHQLRSAFRVSIWGQAAGSSQPVLLLSMHSLVGHAAAVHALQQAGGWAVGAGARTMIVSDRHTTVTLHPNTAMACASSRPAAAQAVSFEGQHLPHAVTSICTD